MKKKSLPTRSEVPVNKTWNLDSIFPSIDAWKEAKDEVTCKIKPLSEFKGRLSESPDILCDFLSLYEKTIRKALLVLVYGRLASSVDATDQEALAWAGQGQSVFVQLNAATSFLDPELMVIGFDTLRSWMKQDERLAYLGHFIDRLEHEKAHVRSDEVEQVLALADEPMSDFFKAYNALTNADLRFSDAVDSEGQSYEVGQSSINSLITHCDRKARQTAFDHYADGYLNHKNTIASIQVGGIHRDIFNARTRNYTSSLEASLSPNDIPPAVFHALIDAFRENLPTWHRYWAVRKRALGVDTLQVYDIKALLSTESPKVHFEQAIDWICEGLSPLGEAYTDVLRKGALEDRWIDRARNRGKRQGAFSSGVYDTHPFIMMSYADDVFSMSTLAHELGHSMHTYYTTHHQPFIYSHYSLFIAEVASNFHQAMLRNYLFDVQQEPAFQLALIEEAMSNFHRYFFIMPTLARWELEVHQRVEAGKPLTSDIMSEICADYFAEGYGEEVSFDKDRVGITWAQFRHMYRNFYVYQYATGISAAHALARRVREGSQNDVDRYLAFLSAGGSVYPLDALKSAGVDMTDPEPVEKAFDVMAGYVDRLEMLVDEGKI